ncbi:hypothetical protein B484DRAFT_398840 [Ochromonadaceae sp. CCMP2298]|nr:hypothetical protein B484DRAFT_398840 [Ochromonadaceae sp. CCMP2298]
MDPAGMSQGLLPTLPPSPPLDPAAAGSSAGNGTGVDTDSSTDKDTDVTGDVPRLVPQHLSSGLVVKSLLWLARAEAVLVVLSLQHQVDRTALALYLGVPTSKLKLASADRVLQETGQVVGNVSPVGHRRPLRTVLDARLLRGEGSSAAAEQEHGPVLCYGGGGTDGVELLLDLRWLVGAGTEVADNQNQNQN